MDATQIVIRSSAGSVHKLILQSVRLIVGTATESILLRLAMMEINSTIKDANQIAQDLLMDGLVQEAQLLNLILARLFVGMD